MNDEIVNNDDNSEVETINGVDIDDYFNNLEEQIMLKSEEQNEVFELLATGTDDLISVVIIFFNLLIGLVVGYIGIKGVTTPWDN